MFIPECEKSYIGFFIVNVEVSNKSLDESLHFVEIIVVHTAWGIQCKEYISVGCAFWNTMRHLLIVVHSRDEFCN